MLPEGSSVGIALVAVLTAVYGVTHLVEANPDSEFTLGHRGWPADVLEAIPEGVETIDLTADQ